MEVKVEMKVRCVVEVKVEVEVRWRCGGGSRKFFCESISWHLQYFTFLCARVFRFLPIKSFFFFFGGFWCEMCFFLKTLETCEKNEK